MKYKVLSLGWGVQSFTLAAMAALGEFERPNVCIHADTTHESWLTYRFAERWTEWLVEHGLKVVTVTSKVEIIINRGGGKIYIPAYTSGLYKPKVPIIDNNDDVIGYEIGSLTESKGQLRRQCTQRWKIAPMRRWIQANREGQPVEMWLGISTDEALRMNPSNVKYITNRWPLIELGMSRKDCAAWLVAHDLEVPPKSACTFCPYHNTAEWRRIKATPDDWDEAVTVDRAIRNARPPYDLFVHPSRKPLEDIDLRTLEEMGQIRLWDEECEGICGV